MGTHSSILAWEITWTGEPSKLQSMGTQRVRHAWACNLFTINECILLTFQEKNYILQKATDKIRTLIHVQL